MKLILSKTIFDKLLSRVEPVNEESCGFLFGDKQIKSKSILTFREAVNINRENKKFRFEIAPEDYLKAENVAFEKGWDLLGIYHTHLDSPPIPSKTDLNFALEEFSYLIISLYDQKFHSIKSWILDNNNKFFKEEELYITKN